MFPPNGLTLGNMLCWLKSVNVNPKGRPGGGWGRAPTTPVPSRIHTVPQCGMDAMPVPRVTVLPSLTPVTLGNRSIHQSRGGDRKGCKAARPSFPPPRRYGCLRFELMVGENRETNHRLGGKGGREGGARAPPIPAPNRSTAFWNLHSGFNRKREE